MINLLYLLAGMVSSLLIMPFFIRKSYTVSRSIVIERPKLAVFEYIKLLKNQDNYSKWARMDSNMQKDYRGTDGTVGFVAAWNSNDRNVGKGEQEIKQIEEGTSIDYELRFFQPFASKSSSTMSTESLSANQTKVTWSLRGTAPYPFNLMLLFMNFEKMIGDDFSVGLHSLKDLLENSAKN